MSLRERIEDAQLLYQNDRHDGALLSVLVAIAATSRKRRPRPATDKDSFVSFLCEEMLVVTGGAIRNYNVQFCGKMMSLGEFFYVFMRCNLAHEGALPNNVQFVKGTNSQSLVVDISEERLELSHSWLDGMANAVKFAPENVCEFPGVNELPDDVMKWFMFGARRDSDHVIEYWRMRLKYVDSYTPSIPDDLEA